MADLWLETAFGKCGPDGEGDGGFRVEGLPMVGDLGGLFSWPSQDSKEWT